MLLYVFKEQNILKTENNADIMLLNLFNIIKGPYNGLGNNSLPPKRGSCNFISSLFLNLVKFLNLSLTSVALYMFLKLGLSAVLP